jgi:hypothetical protein
MHTPSLVEVLIVALGFSIVGTYLLGCRRLINASEKESVEPAPPAESAKHSGQAGSGFVHA